MKMLVLGAGLQGSACAFDLLRSDGVSQVTLADINIDRLPAFLERARSEKLVVQRLDGSDHAAVRQTMAGHAAVMSAFPYYFNGPMAALSVESGCHFSDLGGNTEIVFEQQKLSPQAEARGLSIIPDCGLAPGMVAILAAEGIRRLDTTERVKIYVGGLPQNPEPPLNYQIVYSLEGALDTEAAAQEGELCAGLPRLLAGGESHVNRLIVGHRIQGLSSLFASLAAQKKQCGPLRRLGVGVKSGHGLSGLIGRQRRVAE